MFRTILSNNTIIILNLSDLHKLIKLITKELNNNNNSNNNNYKNSNNILIPKYLVLITTITKPQRFKRLLKILGIIINNFK
jgi:tetraacyldisaccharide-1-P 4'-kinase